MQCSTVCQQLGTQLTPQACHIHQRKKQHYQPPCAHTLHYWTQHTYTHSAVSYYILCHCVHSTTRHWIRHKLLHANTSCSTTGCIEQREKGKGEDRWWEVWVVEDKLECLAQAREGVAITFQMQVLASLNML